MRAVRVVTGRAVPLDRSDVDTDQIIPSDWLKRVERTGFGAGLFAEWRDDRDFVLNDPVYAGASILVAGPNFGIGSSREHAVWALQDYGFEAVVSPRFADIFRSNCTKTGLVPVEVDPTTGRALLDAVQADPALELTVDVERATIEAPAAGIDSSFPPRRVHPDPPAQRLGRHRAHSPLRGRDPGVRVRASGLAADDPLSASRASVPPAARPLRRARRVPGADYHEGQGGSQRRGTRWMMNRELGAPFAAAISRPGRNRPIGERFGHHARKYTTVCRTGGIRAEI